MKDTLVTPADATPEDSAPEGQVSDNSLSKERKLEISDAKKVKHEQTDPIRTDLIRSWVQQFHEKNQKLCK